MSKPVLSSGYHTVTPGFIVPDLGRVLTFLEQTFDAKVVERYDGPDGKILHAEVMIANSIVTCADPTEKHGAMPGVLTVYVDEPAKVDALYQKAIDVGGTSYAEPANKFYGHRTATVLDPGGNKWSISAIVEAVSSDEAHRRLDEMIKKMPAPTAS